MRINSVVGYLFPGIRGPTSIPGVPGTIIPGVPGCSRWICRQPIKCGGALYPYPCLWECKRKDRVPIVYYTSNGSKPGYLK